MPEILLDREIQLQKADDLVAEATTKRTLAMSYRVRHLVRQGFRTGRLRFRTPDGIEHVEPVADRYNLFAQAWAFARRHTP